MENIYGTHTRRTKQKKRKRPEGLPGMPRRLTGKRIQAQSPKRCSYSFVSAPTVNYWAHAYTQETDEVKTARKAAEKVQLCVHKKLSQTPTQTEANDQRRRRGDDTVFSNKSGHNDTHPHIHIHTGKKKVEKKTQTRPRCQDHVEGFFLVMFIPFQGMALVCVFREQAVQHLVRLTTRLYY